MQKYNTCLLKVPLFSNLDDESLIEISNLIESIQINKNEILISQGDALNHLYIIHRGSLKVNSINDKGNEHLVRLMVPGDFIAEHAILQTQVSKFEVTSLEDSTICMISNIRFRSLLKTSPSISLNLVEQLLNRLDEVELKLDASTTLSAKDRLIQALKLRADTSGLVILQVSKKDFASSLGMAPETLSRQLSLLESENIIALNGNIIQLI